jgi:hypothetical protein
MCFGLIFVWLPTPSSPSESNKYLLDIINFYTIPSWIISVLLALWPVALCYERLFADIPSIFQKVSDASWKLEPVQNRIAPIRPRPVLPLYGYALIVHSAIDFVAQFYVWAILWNLFALGCIRSRVILSQHEIWRAYVPVALGGLFGWAFSPHELTYLLNRYRLPLVSKPDMCGFIVGLCAISVTSSFINIITKIKSLTYF